MNWYKTAKWDWREFAKGVATPLMMGMPALTQTKQPDRPQPQPAAIQSVEQPEEPKPTTQPAPAPATQPATQPTTRPTTQPGGHDLSKDLIPQLSRFEGRRATVYKDTKGIPTIGIGFNLTRPDAKAKIEALGLDYEAVLNGTQSLSNQQINSLLSADITAAISNARRFLPSFDRQPRDVQLIVADMAFNLGGAKLGQFRRFKSALEQNDYFTAAQEMRNSAWFRQVGHRGTALAGRMLQVANQTADSQRNASPSH